MRLWLGLIMAAALAGCSPQDDDQTTERAQKPAMAAPMATVSVSANRKQLSAPAPGMTGAKLAYTHDLTVEMLDADIKTRFEQAKAACETNAALGCVVMDAAYHASGKGRPGNPMPSWARLQVTLAHDGIEPFAATLIAPLAGGVGNQPSLINRSDSAVDLTNQIQDVDQHLAQLGDYRDRLTALLKRGDAKVEDLIKLEAALSETQSQIETITAQQKGLNHRVDTEVMQVEFQARQTLANDVSPIRQALARAGLTLSQSVATLLEALIVALPWLLVAVFLIVIGAFGFRRLRPRRRG